MQKAKAFLFVCTGIFLLVLSYHLGASNAKAAPTSTVVGIANAGGQYVVTSNGDVYSDQGTAGHNWIKVGNVFTP